MATRLQASIEGVFTPPTALDHTAHHLRIEAPRHQKTHLLGAFLRVLWGGIEFFAPDRLRPAQFGLFQPLQRSAHGFARQAFGSQRFQVQGTAWLDHEWSEEVLHPQAVGWDWIGMNLDNGDSLTAFQLRRTDGSALWTGGSVRRATEGSNPLGSRNARPGEVRFEPRRFWTSPLTRARYPVEWTVQSPAGRHTVTALADAQELDSRASTGTVYWEGLSDLFDSNGKHVGRGYLEMTGYAQRLVL